MVKVFTNGPGDLSSIYILALLNNPHGSIFLKAQRNQTNDPIYLAWTKTYNLIVNYFYWNFTRAKIRLQQPFQGLLTFITFNNTICLPQTNILPSLKPFSLVDNGLVDAVSFRLQ